MSCQELLGALVGCLIELQHTLTNWYRDSLYMLTTYVLYFMIQALYQALQNSVSLGECI